MACSRSWRPSATLPSSSVSDCPALSIFGSVYPVAVHTSLPSAPWRNRFQPSLFAFLMVCRSSRQASWIRLIPAILRLRLTFSSSLLKSCSSGFNHILDRLHHRFLRACWSKVPTIASRSATAASSTSSTVLASESTSAKKNMHVNATSR